MGGIKRPGEGGRAREEVGDNRERKRETAGVGKDGRDGERREKRKSAQDGLKEGKKMTHFLYCEKSARPAHTHPPPQTNTHARNLRRMSQK